MIKLTLEHPIYNLGDSTYSITSGVLKKGDSKVQLRAKESALLNELIADFPEVLSRETIVARLYKGSYATDASINQLINRLRRTLEDDQRSLVRTIPKQGYVLSIAPIPIVEDRIKPSTVVDHSEITETIEPIPPNSISKKTIGAEEILIGLVCVSAGYGLAHTTRVPPVYLDQISQKNSAQYSLESLKESPIAVYDNQNKTRTFYIDRRGQVKQCIETNKVTSCK